jgi:hypothetical protein
MKNIDYKIEVDSITDNIVLAILIIALPISVLSAPNYYNLSNIAQASGNTIETSNAVDSTKSAFAFEYSISGGVRGIHKTISYESNTKELVFTDDHTQKNNFLI